MGLEGERDAYRSETGGIFRSQQIVAAAGRAAGSEGQRGESCPLAVSLCGMSCGWVSKTTGSLSSIQGFSKKDTKP